MLKLGFNLYSIHNFSPPLNRHVHLPKKIILKCCSASDITYNLRKGNYHIYAPYLGSTDDGGCVGLATIPRHPTTRLVHRHKLSHTIQWHSQTDGLCHE